MPKPNPTRPSPIPRRPFTMPKTPSTRRIKRLSRTLFIISKYACPLRVTSTKESSYSKVVIALQVSTNTPYKPLVDLPSITLVECLTTSRIAAQNFHLHCSTGTLSPPLVQPHPCPHSVRFCLSCPTSLILDYKKEDRRVRSAGVDVDDERRRTNWKIENG